MANRNPNERENLSRDREQPEGWFDPESYKNNLENKDHNKSNYQQTNNPNLANRYDDLNRQRVQNNYSDRNAFDRQYGNSSRDDSRSTFNDSANNPSAKYGDSFDEGYSASGSQRTYRDNNQNNMENRYGMTNRSEDKSRGMNDRDNSFRDRDNRGNRDNRTSGNNDRDWWDKASDEVSSWFGDDDAERRRKMDRVRGPHSGKGPKGYTRTDEKLKDDINERLYHDSHIDASDIDVTVDNGEATLTGTVESKMAKRRIEDIIESIAGVRDVENRLKVKSTSNTVGNYSNDEVRRGNTNGAI